MSHMPSIFRHYTIQAVLGSGDISTLYHAVDTRTDRAVALKMLREDSPVSGALQYFANEANILAELKHPNIPAFYEYVPGETPYFALDYVPGDSLETVLGKHKRVVAENEAIWWGVQLCDTLAYLHGRTPPVIFRGLKPTRVIVSPDDRVWLVGFGLARVLRPNEKRLEPDAAGVEGFSAPEQFRGEVTPLADVYALGAILHTILTHIDPRAERAFTYAPPRSINRELSKGTAAVIGRALAFEPEDRFQSAAEFKDALLACIEDER